jgi:imidazole glycerol-phosphate synthase subunit HisH
MSGATIGLVDYGMGNRRSVEKALERVGARVTVSSNPERLRPLDGLVVPGVGAFPRGISNLRELGLDALVRERLTQGAPVLGVCLGMELAFERSSEQGGAEGLGLIAGEVLQLQRGELKLPHIGWSEVTFTRPSPLIEGLPPRCPFYHVHSFAPVPTNPADILGTAEYGAPFVSAVASDGFYGVQFHPEKSSSAGLRLLQNFIHICRRRKEDVPAQRRAEGRG